jgi:chaperonin GroEL
MDVKQIYYHLQASREDGKALVVIANDFGMEIVSFFTNNKIKNNVPSILIKSPLYGNERTIIMEDLAKMTGATVLSERRGTSSTLGAIGTNDAERTASAREFHGEINRVKSGSDETVIYYDINKDHIKSIKGLLKTKDEFAKKRIALLTGGVATINVGGNSEVEVNEIVDRVEDAVNSTRAALEEGIVAGGGLALNECRKAILSLNLKEESEKIGADIIYRCLSRPMEKILSNAGVQDYDHSEYPIGMDVMKMEEVDLIAAGIIDPVKVVKEALKNSVSVAGTIATSGCLVLYSPED